MFMAENVSPKSKLQNANKKIKYCLQKVCGQVNGTHFVCDNNIASVTKLLFII